MSGGAGAGMGERPDPFGGARFRHRWRSYQARVLDALDEHLADRRLHVVAPPGSGKTVLGLEVVRRLGRPALVLVPSLPIRDQWLDRFATDFLRRPRIEVAGLSTDLRAPSVLTVSTYQAVDRLARGGRLAEVVEALLRADVATLVVDEAHHLRRSWWRALEGLRVGLGPDGLFLVALTATPPYDVTSVEWSRYATLCGLVDEEIGTPELVEAGDLCPHQDLVFLSCPTPEERARIAIFRSGVASLVSDLALDAELLDHLAADPLVARAGVHVDRILAGHEAFLAVAILVGNLRWEAARELLETLGLGGVRLPPFDVGWAEVLLESLLFGKLLDRPLPGRLEARLMGRLRGIGALEGRRVRLESTARLALTLAASPSKIRSVCEIVELEVMSSLHRIVVLADRVRDRAFPSAHDPLLPLVRIGVVPLFEAMRRRRLPGVALAVLTGRLVVVPAALGPVVLERVRDRGTALELVPLPHDPTYLRADLPGGRSAAAVAALTELLGEGLVQVLFGTTALLGEGWDAPAVDTLVLATGIATSVSSNQMRGRAIRVARPEKTANIWHLACAADGHDPGPDLESLAARFSTFVGPSSSGLVSGIERLDLPRAPLDPEAVRQHNRRAVALARSRDELAERWRGSAAIGSGRTARLVREVEPTPRLLLPRFLAPWRAAELGGLAAWCARWWARRLLRRVGRAVRLALEEFGELAPGHRVEIRAGRRPALLLPTGDVREQHAFVGTVAELFDPLASPRYLFRQRTRYWSVPARFGVNRVAAGRFGRAVRQALGGGELVYTRNREGRRHLLRAKEVALLERGALVHRRMRWG